MYRSHVRAKIYLFDFVFKTSNVDFFQYPDAPNLFTNIRRPYRPDVWTEFSRTWLISIIGIALVITGIVTLFYNEVTFTIRYRVSQQVLDEKF